MAAECDVLSEIEVLQSIYLDELLVTRRDDGGWEVSLVLYPSTAEDSVSQFVRLTLTLILDQQYPSTSPSISIHNPRGLSDDKLSSVQKCLQAEAESCLGSPVLYQLIEKAKEILTESNIPHGNCVICLYGFKEGETFTKTSCYHYFHSHCLGRYISHSERELRQREKELEEDKTRERADQQELTVVCPVCREPLTYDVDQLLCSPAPHFPKLEGAAIGADFRQKWCELQKLLERQRAKGGIIDPEVESNRFLIHINEAPSDTENGNLDVDVSPSQSVPSSSTVSSDETAVRADQFHTGPSLCRGGPGQRRQGQMRGPRRGGRGRPQHGRPAPPIEHLDKLSLSSDSTHGHSSEGPIKAKPKGNHSQQKLGELSQSKTDREGSTDLGQQEPPVPTDKEPICQSNSDALKTECPKDAGETASGRGHRGRRRGPHGSAQHPRHLRGTDQWDAPGAGRHHWEGRASRSRGGANNPCGRGGGPRRGHGHGRGFHQRAVEREAGREEVL
ncbi:E3 ubiquitin-protein ligase RNF25 [Centroberyx affinis]|uniref:E3 ubiquitin-protein ligase RNF25 n=1 Tax=Centroberyx affinis TaxID=166261 RepID=UPI003A5BC83F